MPIGSPANGGIAAGAIDAINPGVLSGAGGLGGAGIGAGLSILGDIYSAVSQGHQNKLQRQFALDMYNRQRSDSLADWNMQNAYNSPSAMMQRYRDANLNPNLIYGNGTNAQASMPRASSPGTYQPHPSDVRNLGSSVSGALSQVYDIKLREAQTDNVRASTTAQLEDVNLKKVQEIATLSGAGKSSAETQQILAGLPYVAKLSETDLSSKQANIGKTLAETSSILTQRELSIASTSMSLQEAAQRILSMRASVLTSSVERDKMNAEIKSIDEDARIKKLDADLKAKGIQPHDALWQRKLAEIIEGVGRSFPMAPAAVNPFGQIFK